MNTNPTVASTPAPRRRAPGTNPWQGAVLSAALVVATPPTKGPPLFDPHAKRAHAGFDAAVALYERGEWQPAYERLAQLADEGHALASKLALLMLRHGAPLYGTRFVALPTQVAHWARQVLSATKWN